MKKQSIQFSEYIQRYLDQEMSVDEVLVFQHRLESDSEFNKAYSFHNSVNNFFSDNELLKFNNSLQRINDLHYYRNKKNTLNYKTIYKVAGIILLLSLIIWTVLYLTGSSDNDKIFNRYYKYVSSINVNRSSEQSETTLTIALDHYDNHNFIEAQSALDKLLSENQNNHSVSFYLGLTYIELKEYNKAIQLFEGLLSVEDNFYYDQIKWNLALCYIKTDKKPEALKQLKQIIKDNSYYKKYAIEILSQYDFK